MSAESYSVAVRLSLTNMVSSGLKIIAADLLGLEKNVGRVEEKLKALKMIGVGWGISKAGDGMLGMIGKTVEASKEYTHQVAQMNILGMKQAEIADVISTAWKTSRDVITSSAADNIEAYRELRAVFGAGHEHEALAVLPIAQRASAIISSLTGKMASVKDVGYDISKAAELTTVGGMNEAQLAKRAEQFTKASIAFGGKINMHDFHGALKMTRGASLNYNDDFIAHYFPTLIQEMKTGHAGASGAGVLLRNFDRAVVGQVIPLNKLQTWMDAGLVKAGSVVWNKHHTGLKKINPGGVVGQDLASANPRDWWELYGEAAISKLMKTKGLTDIQAISALGTNQMTTDFFKKLHFQKVQFDRDKILIDQVGSSKDSYDKLLKTDPLLAHKALDKQWDNVLARIGYTILPVILPYMVKFADWLDGIGQWMQHHPVKLQALVGSFLAMGVAFSILGKVMMAAGIIKLLGIGPMLMAAVAPVGLALAAIVVVGLLLWNNWNEISRALTVMWGDIKTGFIQLFHGDISGAFKSFTHVFLLGWQTIFNTLIAGANTILPESLKIKKVHFAGNYDGGETPNSELPGILPKYSFAPPVLSLLPELAKPPVPSPLVAPVPPKQSVLLQLTQPIHLDGKKIAESVTTHMTREASKPQTGTQGFDPSRNPFMPGTPSVVYPR
ncbi:hypothetical protein HK44_020700 [Pseudomonas fluorescens HK44]|uniref:Uncharacterized protein n=1 Tax=Pseudomonas fluorescens HK44 TaxID=1042209 RepID=A0A010RVN2_PSEFL|nr:hypothetical protein [Pseudomonas fluorescens]EXF96291.1 hypothetical protein HK44_020700 [Pseudomonas fluorescens HK44]